MVYSCSWPYYQFTTNISIDYSALSKKCNLWRNYHDIQDYFGPGEGSIVDIVNWYGENRGLLAKFHGPGMWNDPDMMIVGDFGLSYDQSKAHMALWAILAAPLLVSADIRTMKQEYVDILLNRDIIAVDQDELGIMGFRHEIIDRIPGFGCYLQVWKREITPTAFNPVLKKRKYSYAVVFWNLCPDGAPIEVERTLFDLDAHDKAGYYVRDLFAGKNLGHFFPSDKLRLLVNPSGGVVMLKLHLAAAGEPKWANPVQSRWILFLPLDNAADVMLVLFMCCFMLLMLMVVFPFTRRCLFRLMRRLSK